MAAPGGYDVKEATVYDSRGPLNESDLKAVSCCKCELILRHPRQVITCGHLYCEQCLKQLMSGR